MNYAEHLNDTVFANEVALELCRLWSINPVEQKAWALRRLRNFHKHCGRDCQIAIKNVNDRYNTAQYYKAYTKTTQ